MRHEIAAGSLKGAQNGRERGMVGGYFSEEIDGHLATCWLLGFRQMNGHALLLITAFCWGALAFTLPGSFVRRFAVMRKFGMLVLWLAFAIYLPGLAGTLALLYSIIGKEGAPGGLASRHLN